jgi:hypothetical protein
MIGDIAMNNIDLRAMALDYARSINKSGCVDSLLRSATEIEKYLKFSAKPIKLATTAPMDWHEPALDREPFSFLTSVEDFELSGTARDLVKLFNSEDTLVVKARNIGMTALLIRFMAEKTKRGETVLWFSPNRHLLKTAREAVQHLGGNIEKIRFQTLKDVKESSIPTFEYDFLIVDGLGSLSYGDDETFRVRVLPSAKRRILSGEPSTAKGLLYDLWANSDAFQKIKLSWWQTLFPVSVRDFDRDMVSEAGAREILEAEFTPVEPNYLDSTTTTLSTTGALAGTFVTPNNLFKTVKLAIRDFHPDHLASVVSLEGIPVKDSRVLLVGHGIYTHVNGEWLHDDAEDNAFVYVELGSHARKLFINVAGKWIMPGEAD